jgi:putative ABC transport system ATP-binding protein
MTETATTKIVKIENLNHSFGKGPLKKPVLNQIDLAIQAGEIVLLTGPSGSGKTTLLSLVGALRSVQAGSIKVFGEELYHAREPKLIKIRSKIGFIFQAHNLLRSLKVWENVSMALKLTSCSRTDRYAQSMAMLNAVGMGDWGNSYPEKLSGGQKQRVAIARALVKQPQLILADEPTAALDRRNGRDVVDIIQRLAKKQGTAILLVTHDHRIFDIADRIIQMEDGCLIKDEYSVDNAMHPAFFSAGSL